MGAHTSTAAPPRISSVSRVISGFVLTRRLSQTHGRKLQTIRQRGQTLSNTRNTTAEEGSGTPAESVTISTGKAKKVGIYLGVALAVFMLGFLPMWMKSRAHASQRDAAQREQLSDIYVSYRKAVNGVQVKGKTGGNES